MVTKSQKRALRSILEDLSALDKDSEEYANCTSEVEALMNHLGVAPNSSFWEELKLHNPRKSYLKQDYRGLFWDSGTHSLAGIWLGGIDRKDNVILARLERGEPNIHSKIVLSGQKNWYGLEKGQCFICTEFRSQRDDFTASRSHRPIRDYIDMIVTYPLHSLSETEANIMVIGNFPDVPLGLKFAEEIDGSKILDCGHIDGKMYVTFREIPLNLEGKELVYRSFSRQGILKEKIKSVSIDDCNRGVMPCLSTLQKEYNGARIRLETIINYNLMQLKSG
jgi:hypothetical protein